MLLGASNDRRTQACYWFDNSGFSVASRQPQSLSVGRFILRFWWWSKLVKNSRNSQSTSHNNVRLAVIRSLEHGVKGGGENEYRTPCLGHFDDGDDENCNTIRSIPGPVCEKAKEKRVKDICVTPASSLPLYFGSLRFPPNGLHTGDRRAPTSTFLPLTQGNWKDSVVDNNEKRWTNKAAAAERSGR